MRMCFVLPLVGLFFWMIYKQMKREEEEDYERLCYPPLLLPVTLEQDDIDLESTTTDCERMMCVSPILNG